MDEIKLKKILSDVYHHFGIPSVSVSVLSDGKACHAACGMGNIERSLPADKDTIYAIASSTKAFTAAVVCSLAAEGRLDLDEHVKYYIPEFRMVDPYAEENLTVRDILCHRCGLPRHDISMFTWEGFEPSVITDMIAGLTPMYPLRSHWHYQNHMFVLAGELAARVAGKSFKNLVEERILRPLNMNSTYLYGNEIPNDNLHLSVPYTGMAPDFIPLFRDYAAFPAGDGSIYSTTQDMLKWLMFQLYGDEKILPNKYLREMQQPQITIHRNDGVYDIKLPGVTSSSYGLGWFIYTYCGKTLIHHGGTLGGYRSLQMFVPDNDIAISVLMNGDIVGAREATGYTILNELLGISSDGDFDKYRKIFTSDEVPEVEIEKPDESQTCTDVFDADAYTGSYQNGGYGTLNFTAGPMGELMLHISALGTDFVLKNIDEDKFLISFDVYGLYFEVTFLRDNTGNVIYADIPFEPDAKEPIRFERRHNM